jgi:integrase
MTKIKFKIPSDKEIWAEIDAFLSTYPAAIAKVRGLPDRQKLFDEKKAFYSLRHSFATWRIAAGVGVERLSVMMGTDIKFIQDHYWHENLEQEIQLLTADLPDSFRQQTLWVQPDDNIQP